MIRTIKFRAWDVEEERIYEWDDLRDTQLFEDGFDDKDCVLMQFTGLNDSKGKEIYEGDIVDGINIDGETYPMGEVFFDSGCFCIKTKSCDHDYEPCLYEAWAEKIFVVGNIYENPNLLIKGEKNMAEGNNLKITTNYTDDWIDQQVSLSGKMISRQVLYLQDTGVKEALIKLGWTPPHENLPKLIHKIMRKDCDRKLYVGLL